MPSMTTHILDPLDASGRVRLGHRHVLSMLLAAYATADGAGRSVGDPVHEEVTEGRRKANEERRARGSKEVSYSSCGDLCHWVLRCLGCVDERLVNRDDDGGSTPWVSGVNMSRLVGAPGYVAARGDRQPVPGDMPFLMNRFGGHVCVLKSWDPAIGLAVTENYGGPYGKRKTQALTRVGGIWRLDGDPLEGWLDIDAVPLDGPARLPPDVEAAL